MRVYMMCSVHLLRLFLQSTTVRACIPRVLEHTNGLCETVSIEALSIRRCTNHDEGISAAGLEDCRGRRWGPARGARSWPQRKLVNHS